MGASYTPSGKVGIGPNSPGKAQAERFFPKLRASAAADEPAPVDPLA